MVVAVPAVTVGMAAQVAAAQAGVAVPVAAMEMAEAEAVVPAAEAEAVDRFHRAKKRNRQKGPYKGPFFIGESSLKLGDSGGDAALPQG